MRENCKVKIDKDIQNKEIFTLLKKLQYDNEKMKKEIETLKINGTMSIQKIDTQNIHATHVNAGTIINNHITLVAYGKEDLSKINKDEMIKILKNGFRSTIKLTKAVHFNPDYPEHHNIYISNMKDKYAMMFDGINWTLTTKDDLINKIYDDKKNYIEENLEDFVKSLSLSRKNALVRWLETDEDDKKIKEVKENIKLLLYNERHMVDTKYSSINTKNKLKKMTHVNDDILIK
jgi:hypothetical protein